MIYFHFSKPLLLSKAPSEDVSGGLFRALGITPKGGLSGPFSKAREILHIEPIERSDNQRVSDLSLPNQPGDFIQRPQ
jgi:hypothetical protein